MCPPTNLTPIKLLTRIKFRNFCLNFCVKALKVYGTAAIPPNITVFCIIYMSDVYLFNFNLYNEWSKFIHPVSQPFQCLFKILIFAGHYKSFYTSTQISDFFGGNGNGNGKQLELNACMLAPTPLLIRKPPSVIREG